MDGLAAFRYVVARARNGVAAREKSGAGDYKQNDESHHGVLLRNVRVAGSGCEPDTFQSKLERQKQADARGLLRCINNRRCPIGIVVIPVSVAVTMMIVMPVCLAWGGMALVMLLAAVVSLFRLQRRCCDEAGDR